MRTLKQEQKYLSDTDEIGKIGTNSMNEWRRVDVANKF
jgi:hypothetical protein